MARDDYRHAVGYVHRITRGQGVFYFREAPATAVLDGVEAWLAQPQQARLTTQPLPDHSAGLFGKRLRIRTLRKQVRASRGPRQKNGRYDWLAEEIINTAQANRLAAHVPELIGYSYVLSRLGWVKEQFMVTRRLDGYCNGMQWLEAHPGAVRQLLGTLFGVLHALHQKGISHLDLWAGNLMIADAADQPAMAIDLENCFTTTPRFLAQVLALQFALPYRISLYPFITEADYDLMVHEALQAYGAIDLALFRPLYRQAKHQRISNAARRPVFTCGVLG